jgi:ribonuclease BN (tRNA processing enzyme)
VRTRVVLLGTGTPNVDPERSGPALAIVVDQTAYLVDVGAGVVVRADAAYRRGIEALRVDRIRHAFVTHLHTDHTLGLPDLVFSPWVLERDQPLQLFGPPGLRSMVDHVQQAWSEDVRIRLEGLEPANTEGYKTVVHEFESGLVHKDELVTVHAFRVPHGSFRYALGYRFETPDRVIVVSGDTAPSEALIEAAKDCDVLVHEVYSAVSYQTRPDVWKAYHASFHTSSVELAAIANRARPKLLVLTHQLFWGRTERQLLDEVREHYDGAVVSGRDLDVF